MEKEELLPIEEISNNISVNQPFEEEISPYHEWSKVADYFLKQYLNFSDALIVGKDRNLCLVKMYFTLKNGQSITYLLPHIFASGHYPIKETFEENMKRLPYSDIGLPFSTTTPFNAIYYNFSALCFDKKIAFLENFMPFFEAKFQEIDTLKKDFINLACHQTHHSLLYKMHRIHFATFKQKATAVLTFGPPRKEEMGQKKNYFMDHFIANFFSHLSLHHTKEIDDLRPSDISDLPLHVFEILLHESLYADNLAFTMPLKEITEDKFSMLEALFIIELFYHSEQIAYCYVRQILNDLPHFIKTLPEEDQKKLSLSFNQSDISSLNSSDVSFLDSSNALSFDSSDISSFVQAIHFCFHTDRDPCFQCQETVLSIDEDPLNEPYKIKVFLTGGKNYRSKTIQNLHIKLANFNHFYKSSYKFFMLDAPKLKTRRPEELTLDIKLFTRRAFLEREYEEMQQKDKKIP